ncbi:MAG: Rrf2 family transcriptional regulator [Candidatus Aceula lacicola]|nr:Rrf2 family transcriptional regulator [Candidatus Aceula lacicola]
MDLLNRDTDYAVRAIIFLSKRKGDLTSSLEIEKELGIPRPFLRKILQVLKKNKILESVKGNKGGFVLLKDSRKIFLSNVVEIFQGKIDFAQCLFKKKICPAISSCPLRKKIKGIESSVSSQLGKITIASLTKGQKR